MNRSKYSPEFKRQAVNLINAGEKPVTVIAKELGVKRSLLYTWRDQHKTLGGDVFKPVRGRPKKENATHTQQLETENKRLKEELEILKKAAAYFARDLL